MPNPIEVLNSFPPTLAISAASTGLATSVASLLTQKSEAIRRTTNLGIAIMSLGALGEALAFVPQFNRCSDSMAVYSLAIMMAGAATLTPTAMIELIQKVFNKVLDE